MLVTPQEIIHLAYSEKIMENQIASSIISAAEEIYIKPYIKTDSAFTDYSQVIQNQIKYTIAYWVRFLSFYQQFKTRLSEQEMQLKMIANYNKAMHHQQALAILMFKLYNIQPDKEEGNSTKSRKKLVNGFLV